MTLFSFGNFVTENRLAKAFEQRLQYEIIEHNQIIDGNQFNKSVRLLLNGFISSTLYTSTDRNRRSYNFINPSLADFLIGQISESFSDRKAIIQNVIYLDQLNRFNPKKSIIPLDKELQSVIRDLITNDKFVIDKKEAVVNKKENNFNSKILSILSTYCKQVNIDNVFLKHFKTLNFSENWDYFVFSEVLSSLLIIKDCPQTETYIKKNFIKIVGKLMLRADSDFEAEQIIDLFDKYEQDYVEFSKSKDGESTIIQMIENIIETTEDELSEQIKDEVTDFTKVEEIYDEIFATREKLIEDLFPDLSYKLILEVELDKNHWNDIIEENQVRESMRDYESWEENEFSKENSGSDEYSETEKIDDLFN